MTAETKTAGTTTVPARPHHLNAANHCQEVGRQSSKGLPDVTVPPESPGCLSA
jgi:hypothetical protein